jgi:dihydroorotate dehydrogenase (fumarate)
MDLSTNYLGLRLPHPIMPGACPLPDDLDMVRRLEDAGAPAIVLRSLFEEQIVTEQIAAAEYIDTHENAFAEALDYMPQTDVFALGPDEYLRHLSRIKMTVDVPVIGSLNGSTPGGWLRYARAIASAGADALELNVYHIATDFEDSAVDLEHRICKMISSVNKEVDIPVVVKLSPSYTALPNLVKQLQGCGADGFILFNRFYQPDFDIESLETQRTLKLSTSDELLQRLHWTAILSGRLHGSLAISGGVHDVTDVVKSVMAGAHVVQVVSALLRHGPGRLTQLRDELAEWLEEHGYKSLEEMQGSMNLLRCPDPRAYERVNYMELLQSWGR